MTKHIDDDEKAKREIAKRMIQRAIDEGRLVRLPSGSLIEKERATDNDSKPMKGKPNAETKKADALRRMLRVEMGRRTRKPATNRADNAMVRAPRKPSMPKMPRDAARRELKDA